MGVIDGQARKGVLVPDFEDSKCGATEEDLRTVDQTTVHIIDPSFASEMMMFWKLRICLSPESWKSQFPKWSLKFRELP
ncbi:hypothetical protein MTR67_024061 [Solanum verrucosum]|uniref:Uncharacterized protein n=1 Tax=Solanum verrucosum TaxID=315347 RepID=A0AAF0QWC5_SOLVR|nr:hypothetical protein MTR67_024061 [Solanum verrucosum]